MGNIMKYLVRPLNKDSVCESIFETVSLIEALEMVEEQNKKCNTKYIIVSNPDDEFNNVNVMRKPQKYD